MFFVISKLAFIFITPANWIIALLVWRFVAKSAVVKKRLTIVIIALVLFFGNEVIYSKLVNAWQAKPVQLPKNVTYEAGILLGGLGSFDKYGNGFLNSSCDRLVEICALYHGRKIKKIVISGGSVYKNRPKEAPFLFKKITELGIPANDIIIEKNSRTTFENAAYTKLILDSIKLPPPYVLVTSAMHVPRAKRVFAKAGLQVVPYPSDYRVLETRFVFFDYIIPSINTIDSWASFLKEVVGIMGYKLFNKA